MKKQWIVTFLPRKHFVIEVGPLFCVSSKGYLFSILKYNIK